MLEDILLKGKNYLNTKGSLLLSISNVANELLEKYEYFIKPCSQLKVPMRFGSDSPFIKDKLEKGNPWPYQTLQSYIIKK